MKLSTKGRYGLRALIDLAMHCETEAVSISCIAMRQGISESYLEQLMGKLRKAGLIVSVRGAQGGYRLAKDAAEIFNTMTDDLELVAKILQGMNASARGNILAEMNADTAAKVTEILNPSR